MNISHMEPHNKTRVILYRKWYDMKRRCNDPKDIEWKYYGARGIKVCERWLIFNNFIKDMYPTYKMGLTMGRINNNNNYGPKNCRWETDQQQRENRSDNHFIEYKGIRDTLTNWARFLKITKATLWARLNYLKWSVKDSLERGTSIG